MLKPVTQVSCSPSPLAGISLCSIHFASLLMSPSLTPQRTPQFTLDHLQAEQEEIMRLAASAQGGEAEKQAAKLHLAQLQSPSLFSDMQSFLAANPTASFEDFIRWFSPSDWNPTDELSEENEATQEKKVEDALLETREDLEEEPDDNPETGNHTPNSPSPDFGTDSEDHGMSEESSSREAGAAPVESRTSKLSRRMAQPDNIWQQLWNVRRRCTSH